MTRKVAATHDRPPMEAGLAGAAWLADWSQQQAAVAAATGEVMLRGLEAMRRIGEEATRQAAQRHSVAARRMHGQAPADLVAAQADLLRGDLEGVARCCQDLGAAAMETATELMACTARLIDTEAVFAAAHGTVRSS